MGRIERIAALLDEEYGRPQYDPKHGPLDELVLTILSQNTAAVNYTRAFAELRRRFGSWDEVRLAKPEEIEQAIRSGGLAAIKARRIKGLLEEVYSKQGALDLGFLSRMADEDALEYLLQFDGVGPKTAACVLMFSLGRPVFPVDTHVHRIAKRLGLIGPLTTAEAAQIVLQGMIPGGLVYSLHVNLVRHGRKVCRAGNPLCEDCVVLELCPAGQAFLVRGG